ncbi:ribosome modulation factor [Vibrio eleionomae]|nr:hypothetical protein [Vibrio eleionomae]
MNKQQESAFNDGYLAFGAGHTDTANPYKTTEYSDCWRQGWFQAQHDFCA